MTTLQNYLGLSKTTKSESDLEKFVKYPQAEISEINNVLKIMSLVSKNSRKYVYQLFVWHDEIQLLLCENTKFFYVKSFLFAKCLLSLGSPAYGILEQLINTLVYMNTLKIKEKAKRRQKQYQHPLL